MELGPQLTFADGHAFAIRRLDPSTFESIAALIADSALRGDLVEWIATEVSRVPQDQGSVFVIESDAGIAGLVLVQAAGDVQCVAVAAADDRVANGVALELADQFNGATFIESSHPITSHKPIPSTDGTVSCCIIYAGDQRRFDTQHFTVGPTRVETLTTGHRPGLTALLASGLPGQVRSIACDVVGHGPSLRSVAHLEQRTRSAVLVRPRNNAVVGVASIAHNLRDGATVLDVYCHPQFWGAADRLFDAIGVADTDERCVAYVEHGFLPKTRVLGDADFTHVSTEKWDGDDESSIEVEVFEKQDNSFAVPAFAVNAHLQRERIFGYE